MFNVKILLIKDEVFDFLLPLKPSKSKFMSTKYQKLLLKALFTLGVLVGIPHIFPSLTTIKTVELPLVDYVFYILNELSFIYLFVPFFIIELIAYYVKKQLTTDLILDSVTNAITLFAYYAIEYVLGGLIALKLYAFVGDNMILPELPLTWFSIVFYVLLADFAYYWEHRLMHRIGFGWLTHTVHHSSPHFNMSVAYRFGPLDSLIPLFFSVPMVLLGLNPYLLFLAEIFVQVYQAILHTEIIKKLPKPIEYLFNTPSHHRVHHGSNLQYWDKNYSGILIIWDRLFGTFAQEEEKVVYGIFEPIESVNPFVVFFHGITRFYHKMIQIKGVKNKLLLFIKPPDWEPVE